MQKKISAVKARQNLGQIMNEVAIRGDDYIIERAGKPLVAIIPLEKYLNLQIGLDTFALELEKMQVNVKNEDPRIIDEAIEEAIQAIRNSKGKAKKKR